MSIPSNIPQSISGLQLWFDANDPNCYTLSESNITQLKDKSGLSNNTTGYYVTQPTFQTNAINGLPVFNMANGGFNGNFSISNTGPTLSFFTIVSINSYLQYGRLIAFGNTDASNDGKVSYKMSVVSPSALSTNFRLFPSNTGSNTMNTNTPYLVSGYYDGTNGYIGVNGYYNSNANSTNFNITKYGIGMDTMSYGEPSDSKFGEVLVYNTALSTSDRQKTEGYLAWKWGINASLPTNHLYFNLAPFLTYSTANRFNQTYMQNFLDISGNLIIRNGSLTIPNGNVSVFRNTIISGSTFTNTQNITINSGGGSNGIIGNTLNVNSNAIIGGNLFTNYNSQFTNTNISVNGDARFNCKFLNTAKSNNRTLSDASINSGDILLGGRILNGKSTVSIPLNDSNTAIVSANNVNSSSMYLELPLPNNTTGNCNVAMGFTALSINTTGCCNTAIGNSSMLRNTIGNYNTAVGTMTNYGYANPILQTSNTTIGANSASNTQNGINNTIIGAFINAPGANSTTAIGYASVITASNQIVFGKTSEIGYTSGRVTIGTISTSSTYKLTVGGTSGTYLTGDISANNIYINGGQNLFQLLKSINTGFVINATYDGNFTSGNFFSINGFPGSNNFLVGCNSCIAYYCYISCKTNPTNISSASISIQNHSNEITGSPINIVTNQLTYSGPLTASNNISGPLNSISYFNRLSIQFYNNGTGGTFWKVSILCQYI